MFSSIIFLTNDKNDNNILIQDVLHLSSLCSSLLSESQLDKIRLLIAFSEWRLVILGYDTSIIVIAKQISLYYKLGLNVDKVYKPAAIYVYRREQSGTATYNYGTDILGTSIRHFNIAI